MNLQELFYLTASIFFLLTSVVLIVGAILIANFYKRVTLMMDRVGDTINLSNTYMLRLQRGIYGTILGLIKLFR